MKLKKKIVFPAGTKLFPGPATISFGSDLFEGLVALNDNATARVFVYADDSGVKKFLED